MAAAAPILKYYNVNEPVTIQCDASEYGLGAALLQCGKPVAYASKALTSTERKYAQIEKETLAIVFACERFEQYLSGKDLIIVESDHKPLEVILRKPILSAPRRLQRMMLRLQRFNIDVHYKKGEHMYIADLLSRAMPLQHEEVQEDVYGVGGEDEIYKELRDINQTDFLHVKSERLTKIRLETSKDGDMKELITHINLGWPDQRRGIAKDIKDYWAFREKLIVQDGLVLKGMRLVIPRSMRPEILKR